MRQFTFGKILKLHLKFLPIFLIGVKCAGKTLVSFCAINLIVQMKEVLLFFINAFLCAIKLKILDAVLQILIYVLIINL